MVRLKANKTLFTDYEGFGFNSNMVRLKVFPLSTISSILSRFNSNMVRLKATVRMFRQPQTEVSIPIWFD